MHTECITLSTVRRWASCSSLARRLLVFPNCGTANICECVRRGGVLKWAWMPSWMPTWKTMSKTLKIFNGMA